MFVREPIAGAVKTRLVPALGAVEAAVLYRAFVEDACARLAPHVPLARAVEGAVGGGFLATVARRHGLQMMEQGTGDLGARMRHVADAALRSVPSVVVIGSDAPTLPIAHVTAALRTLAPPRASARRGAR